MYLVELRATVAPVLSKEFCSAAWELRVNFSPPARHPMLALARASPPDRTRREPTDGTATTARRPSLRRVKRRNVPPLLPHTRNTSAHIGTPAETKEKSPICKPAAFAAQRVWETGASDSASAFGLADDFSGGRGRSARLHRQLLTNRYERAAHFVHHRRKVHHQQSFFRIDHHIHGHV